MTIRRSFRSLVTASCAIGLAHLTGMPALAGSIGHDLHHAADNAVEGQAGDVGHSGHASHDHSSHDHSSHGQGQYIRNTAEYPIPDASLRDQTGRQISFAEAIAHDGPLLVNFIFTSCSTVCPVMSATFGEAQDDIAAIEPGYRMVSVSIDPEYDTPRRLREYASLHHARENWTFLTGDAGEIRKVIAAFDAIYRGDNKMYHLPYTYLRRSADLPWTRIEGLLSGGELISEFRALLAPRAPEAY